MFIMKTSELNATTSPDCVKNILTIPALMSENEFFSQPYSSKIESHTGRNKTRIGSNTTALILCYKKNSKFFYEQI